MSETVYHYTTNKFGGRLGIAGIDETGVIKTEKELLDSIGKGDDYTMDYVWLTKNEQVPGACINFVLGFVEFCAQGNIQPHQLPQLRWSNTVHTFKRYAFDSDTIGAQWWPKARNRWVGASVKRKKFAWEIDYKSGLNGDNVLDYFVCDKPIPVAQAISVDEIQISDSELGKRLGFDTPEEMWYSARSSMEKNRNRFIKHK